MSAAEYEYQAIMQRANGHGWHAHAARIDDQADGNTLVAGQVEKSAETGLESVGGSTALSRLLECGRLL